MSYNTILIIKKENVLDCKKELFSTRQKSLSFIEDNDFLLKTESFKDSTKYSLIFVESNFTSFSWEEKHLMK